MSKNIEIWATTRELLLKNFVVAAENNSDEANFLAALSYTVARMLAEAPERLFALLYQLDVCEKKIQAALSPTAALLPSDGIALLIVEREKQKAMTRLKYQSPTIITDDDAELW